MSNTEFESAVPGMSHLVSGPKNRTLFLPVSLVSVVQDMGGGEVVQGKGAQGGVEQSVTTTELAKAMNMSKQQLIKQQQNIMKEVNENKEIAEIQAVDPELDVERQREAMRKYEKKPQPGTQSPPQLPPKGTGPTGREGRSRVNPPGQSSAGTAGGSRMRRQPSNTYEPMPGPQEEDRSGSQRLPPPNRAPNGTSVGAANVHQGPGLGSSQPHPQPASPAVRSDQPPIFPTPTSTDPYHGEQQPHPPFQQYGEGVNPAVSQSQVPPPAVGLPHANIIVSPPHATADPRLEEESMVEVTTTAAPLYGVIKWIGNLPNVPYRIAGVELVSGLVGM